MNDLNKIMEKIEKSKNDIEVIDILNNLNKFFVENNIYKMNNIMPEKFKTSFLYQNFMLIDVGVDKFIPKEIATENFYLNIFEKIDRNKNSDFSYACKYLSKKINKNLLSDKKYILKNINKFAHSIENISSELKKDNEILDKAIKIHPYSIFEADQSYLNKEKLINWLNDNENYFYDFHWNNLPKNLKEDKEIFKKILEKNNSCFNISDEMITFFKVKDMALEIIKKDFKLFNKLCPQLRTNLEITKIVLEKDLSYFPNMSESIRSNKEIALYVLNKQGELLKFVSQELKKDKEIVLTAIDNNGYALRYANSKFKKDKDMVIKAVNKNSSVLEFINDELKNDKQFLLSKDMKKNITLKLWQCAI